MNQEIVRGMTEENCQLVNAACAAAALEVDKLVRGVISALREMDAIGMFDDVAARHLWDEYCWQIQEGTHGDGDIGFGCVRENYEKVLNGVVADAVNALPKHALLFLSIKVRRDLDDVEDSDIVGGISHDAIASVVRESVNELASRRNLDVIGPSRADFISMEVSLDGLAGDALSDAGECSDFLSEHADALLEGDADNLAIISAALLDRYMELLCDDADGMLLSALLGRFENEIRALVLEKDIIPAVEDAMDQLKDEP